MERTICQERIRREGGMTGRKKDINDVNIGRKKGRGRNGEKGLIENNKK